MKPTKRATSRRHPRHEAHLPASLVDGAREVGAETLNLSEGGVALRVPRRLELFGLVDLVLKQGGATWNLTGMVTHQEPLKEGGYGVGVDLHFYGEHCLEPWARLVSQLALREKLNDRWVDLRPGDHESLEQRLLWQLD